MRIHRAVITEEIIAPHCLKQLVPGHGKIDIAKFLGNKVYLELFVKVEADWRNRKHYLKAYGYDFPKK